MKKKFPPLRSFVIGGNPAIDRIFTQKGFTLAKGLGDAEVVIFQGGSDVSPYLYGAEINPRTNTNPKRDQFEFACYKATRGLFRIGICRGAQFLNVMNGGWLWQHVDGHGGPHKAIYQYTTPNGAIVKQYYQQITSTHHQLIHPNEKTADVWCTASQSTLREMGQRTDGEITTMALEGDHRSDVEVCYYRNTQSLCFQPHPEYNSQETRDLFFDCVERALERN